MTFTDITLFNRYFSQHDVFYQRAYLYKVGWGGSQQALATPVSFKTLISIPFEQCFYYREPKVWKSDKTGYWTLQVEDVIVKGIVEVQIAAQTDLYGNYSLSDLKNNFELVTVSDISLNDAPISQQKFSVGVN